MVFAHALCSTSVTWSSGEFLSDWSAELDILVTRRIIHCSWDEDEEAILLTPMPSKLVLHESKDMQRVETGDP